MKNNTAFQNTSSESKRLLEFLTIFGISLMFTFAGMQFIKNEMSAVEEEPQMEIPYASCEQAELPTFGVEKVAEALAKMLP